jgi:hypothetical protein
MLKKLMHFNGSLNLNFIGLIMMDTKMQLLELLMLNFGILINIWAMGPD